MYVFITQAEGKSKVWSHFTKDSSGVGCNICGASFSQGLCGYSLTFFNLSFCLKFDFFVYHYMFTVCRFFYLLCLKFDFFIYYCVYSLFLFIIGLHYSSYVDSFIIKVPCFNLQCSVSVLNHMGIIIICVHIQYISCVYQ